MRLDLSKLEKVHRNPDRSITCRCPACALEGGDKTGNHLRIWPSAGFNCVLHTGDKQHNAIIRSILRGTALDDNPDIEYIDPEPTSVVEKVYPEEVLSRLIPNYDYWLNRGIKEEVLKKLEVGIAPLEEKSKLSGRTVFPIRNLDGRLVGFSGRILEENSFAPKYKHMMKASKICWPWNVAGTYIKNSKTAVLVEGASDLITLMSHDIWNVLALFGLNINSKIISTLISASVNRVYISTNRDEDSNKGQRAAEKIADRLSVFFAPENIIIRLPPEGRKDWNECNIDEIAMFREEIKA